jgi:hypothetical protein
MFLIIYFNFFIVIVLPLYIVLLEIIFYGIKEGGASEILPGLNIKEL